MASTTLAVRSRAVSHNGAQPLLPVDTIAASNQPRNNTHHTNNHHNPSSTGDNIILHAHRQNHNSSKLPAFRFADLKKDRISLPSLHQQQQPTPPEPVLSQTAAEPLEQTRRIPGASQPGLHHYGSAQTLPARPSSFESQQTGDVRTRSLKFHLPSSAATTIGTADPSSSTASRRPASYPRETHKSSASLATARSRLSFDDIPAVKRRLTEGAIKESASQGQGEPLEKTPRTVIPPIRSFRSSGSRRSAGNDSVSEPVLRDRAPRAVVDQEDEDFPHVTPSEIGEMTTTTDNDNTADIFMRIARDEPAPRAPEKQAPAAEPTGISRIVKTSHRRPLSAAIPAHDIPSPPRMSRRLSDQRDNSRSRQAADASPAQQTTTRDLAYRASTRESLPPLATAADSSSRAQTGRTSLKSSPITPRQISFKDGLAESSSAYQRRRQSLTENGNLSASRTTPYRSSAFATAQSRTYHSSPLVPKSANVQADASHNSPDVHHGVEGTESSSSTAAPSTVWDELDDLKSRIHRLERTGKLPSGAGPSRSSDERPRTATTNATTMSASPKQGSGAGLSQANGGGSLIASRETQPLLLSALGKTRELVHPEVYSAIESAANDALALSSMMGTPGQPGPISSSASTVGGYNSGLTDRQLRKKADSICRSLTELCLALADTTPQRKQPQPRMAALEPEPLISPTSHKAVAEVLTPQRRPSAIAETVARASTSPRAPTALEQKRKTMLAGLSLPSPRYATTPSTPLEPNAGRKSSLILSRIRRSGTEEPDETPQTGRRSSLLLRTRRTGDAAAEEPESDPLALRSDTGRKTSLLLRTRQATLNGGEEDVVGLPRAGRVPSRAITEVNSLRSLPPREQLAHYNNNNNNIMAAQEHSNSAAAAAAAAAATASPLPRARRFIPSAIATRLGGGGSGTASVPLASPASAPLTPARKYLERSSLGDRGAYFERGIGNNSISERLAEERGQQQQQQQLYSPAGGLSRAGSLGRRTARESGIPSLRS